MAGFPKRLTDLAPVRLVLESRDNWCSRLLTFATDISNALPMDSDERKHAEERLAELKSVAEVEAAVIGMALSSLDVAFSVVSEVIQEELAGDVPVEERREALEKLYPKIEELLKQRLEELAAEEDEAPKSAAPDPLGEVDIAVPADAFKNAG